MCSSGWPLTCIPPTSASGIIGACQLLLSLFWNNLLCIAGYELFTSLKLRNAKTFPRYVPIKSPCAVQILTAAHFWTDGNLGSVSAEMGHYLPIYLSCVPLAPCN